MIALDAAKAALASGRTREGLSAVLPMSGRLSSHHNLLFPPKSSHGQIFGGTSPDSKWLSHAIGHGDNMAAGSWHQF